MKKLFLVLLLLIVPQSAWGQEIVWGSKFYGYLGIKCSTPDKSVRDNVLKEINIFLNPYKKEILKNYLQKIVVCGHLSRDGQDWYRGTYVPAYGAVFVEVGDGLYNDTEYVLHHELSSIVWLKAASYKTIEKWKSFSSFEYEVEGNIVSNWVANNEEQEAGALFQYCKTTPENDFNVVAAYYMAKYLRPELDRAMKEHFRIRAKVRIFEEIYKDLFY